ncbi:TPA: 3'-5' exonuclease [Streptococcus pneumoniae]|nr:3'-5' exonuclease [Streptococcus pneumoniae]HET4446490.1 3'-5' exonuclease [Streptococcus pneumoniae]HET4704726.1 3'-5' exonuclease [Streptococcus pneumoniae]HET4718771.1 3'-5' exonuclease [Streptococcus pneumoniae]HET4722803.1 3'-5' exonuclease [Streptococcus pneumoniae]
MERLEDYIAFDLEFNQHEGQTHLIQVSAVRFRDGREIDAYDSYVHTSVPLKSFINGLTGITAERRSSDLHGIANLKLQTVASFLGFQGQSHNSLEDARMTARVYESFLESDQARELLETESSLSNNPFGGLDLSQLFD